MLPGKPSQARGAGSKTEVVRLLLSATELRSTGSVALILRVASRTRRGRDAQNDETSIHFPRVDSNFTGRGLHS